MPTDNRTSELVINKLSKQQYENIQNPSNTELYLVPEDEEHKPICYPTTASDVKTTSMVVKSSVSDNGKILTEVGFVYNTSGNPTISDTKIVCDLGAGFMEKVLENLTQNTEYHIKSYGQNSSGLVYGSELVQRTLPSPIPSTYQLVEYLESSGTQYIMTNISFNSTLLLNFKDVVISAISTSSPWRAIFGCHEPNSQNRCYLQKNIDNNTFQSYVNSTQIYSNAQAINVISELEMYISLNRVYIKFDGSFISDMSSTFDYIPNKYFYLFRLNTSATSSYNYFTGHIGRLKVFDGSNNLLFGMYPVYRIADNKPGMYDIVNNIFYTNAGTGEFVVGPDKEWEE